MTAELDHRASTGMTTLMVDATTAASARIGETRVHKDQNYICTDVTPYTRRDGSESALLVWESRCAECGKPFTFKTPNRERFEPNRRCQVHKRRSGPKTVTPQQSAGQPLADYTEGKQRAIPLLDADLLDDEVSDLWPMSR